MSAKLKDGAYLDWSAAINKTCHANQAPAQRNISVSLLAQFDDLQGKAAAAYQANHDPEKKNHYTAANQRAAMAALKRFASTFVQYLKGNPLIPDGDLDGMKISPRHPGAHEPVPVPAETPVLTALTGQHHDITVYVSTLQHGQPTTYLTNRKHHAFMLRYRFKGEQEWLQKISTKKHLTLVFGDDAEAKYLQLEAAWLNPTLQAGPWSETVEELIN